jgi:hypothetical protein
VSCHQAPAAGRLPLWPVRSGSGRRGRPLRIFPGAGRSFTHTGIFTPTRRPGWRPRGKRGVGGTRLSASCGRPSLWPSSSEVQRQLAEDPGVGAARPRSRTEVRGYVSDPRRDGSRRTATIADTASAQRMRSRSRGASGFSRDEGGVSEHEERGGWTTLCGLRWPCCGTGDDPRAVALVPTARAAASCVRGGRGRTRTCANYARSTLGIGPLG